MSMDFTTENLINFFNKKLEEAKDIDPVNDKKGLSRWWSSVERCCEKMGAEYLRLLGNVRFKATAFIIDNPEYNRIASCEARKNGLEEAKNNINKIIDDLKTFGYTPEIKEIKKDVRGEMVNNITLNNNQISSINVDFQDFDSETRKIIDELKAELTKKEKNKDAIRKILDKLVDTSIDVLAKIFLHYVGA